MSRTLLVLTDKPGATQHISFTQPLQQGWAGGRIKLVLASGQDAGRTPDERLAFWEQHQPSTLVLSRYSDDTALGFLQLARDCGVPSIFHLDDDLLDVPLSLGRGKHKYYHQPQRLATLRAALNACDLVYASTGELAWQLVQHGIHTPVHSGALYCTAAPEQLATPVPASTPVIGYMGTGGHSQDLAMVMPALTQLMDELPALRFETFGTITPPPEMERFGARYLHHAGVADYEAFLATLCGLGWWVGIAPLEDNPFNRCKADTKWVEYSVAGLAVVASDLPVYHRACAGGAGVLATTQTAWTDALRRLVCDGAQRQRMVLAARDKLRRAYARPLLRQQLLEVMEAARLRHGEQAGLPAPSSTADAGAGRRPSTRILFVANNLIPTLQLSFLEPLAGDVAAGELAWTLVSGDDLASMRVGHRGKSEEAVDAALCAWLSDRFDAFAPTHVVFCRYSDRHADHLRQHAARRGVPVLFHIDDDLLNVPPEIGAAKHRLHNQPERLASVRYLLDHADLVYCSTQALLERLRALGVQSRMMAGQVYCAGAVRNPATLREVRTIGYMGFDHAHDFEIVLPVLVPLLRARPGLRFELFGSIPRPPMLDEFGDRVSVIEPVRSYAEFMARFASLHWDIGLCPLAPTGFNRAKANTKWVEYSAVGAAVIASRGVVYDDCCADGAGFLADTPDEWLAALQWLCDNPGARQAMVAQAQRRLEADYSAARLRHQVKQVLSLASGLAAYARQA